MQKEKAQHHQSQENNQSFDDLKFELKFHLGKNTRYHSKRSAFFSCWNNTNKIVSYMVGSATIVSILAEQYQTLAVVCNALVLLLNAFDSFIGFGDKARDYREFYIAYKKLEMKLRDAKIEDDLNAIWKEADQIELNEPNTLNVLMEMCWNEELLYSGGERSQLMTIKWYQRLLAQFMDINAISISAKQSD